MYNDRIVIIKNLTEWENIKEWQEVIPYHNISKIEIVSPPFGNLMNMANLRITLKDGSKRVLYGLKKDIATKVKYLIEQKATYIHE